MSGQKTHGLTIEPRMLAESLDELAVVGATESTAAGEVVARGTLAAAGEDETAGVVPLSCRRTSCSIRCACSPRAGSTWWSNASATVAESARARSEARIGREGSGLARVGRRAGLRARGRSRVYEVCRAGLSGTGREELPVSVKPVAERRGLVGGEERTVGPAKRSCFGGFERGTRGEELG